MLQPGNIQVDTATPITVSGMTVNEIYKGQKDELVTAIRRALEAAIPLDFDVQTIARLMHNLAGTSSYFDEAQIGDCAMRLEHPLRSANSTEAIKAICTQMLTVLD